MAGSFAAPLLEEREGEFFSLHAQSKRQGEHSKIWVPVSVVIAYAGLTQDTKIARRRYSKAKRDYDR